MKNTINSLILIAGISLHAHTSIDCKVHIDVTQDDPEKVVLTLSHDKNCEVIMEHNTSQITIVPRKEDAMTHNQAGEDSTTADLNITEKLITLAKSKLGDSYAPAQAGPDHFDCSGFVYYLFKTNGINIPRSSLEQSKSGKKLTRSEIKRGDILFFDTYNRNHVNHSGVYLEKGKFIHSSSGKAYGVTISELDKGFYKEKFHWGIRKIETE
ncbi:MAG: C40 family peptidase [Campylobacterota bacterium]|nr:C40 family peptidase [Campylobacterota bacterium]